MAIVKLSKNIDKHIIFWLPLLRAFRDYKLENSLNLSINDYFLLFLFYKYLLLKDICLLYYKDIFLHYDLNLYSNCSKKEFRFFFLYYYIMFFKIRRDTTLYFFDYCFINFDNYLPFPSSDDFRKIYPSSLRPDRSKNIFFYHNYIFFYIYLIKRWWLYLFFLRFDKLNFLLVLPINDFILYNDFILKVDYASFFLQRRYLAFFRLFKYNEYLTNNRLFWEYPMLKHLLHIKHKAYRVKHSIFFKHIIINYINIYKLQIYKPAKNKYIFTRRPHDYSILHRKTTRNLNYNSFKYHYIDNLFIINNINKQNISKFLYLYNNTNIFCILNINILNTFYASYVAFLSYKVYHSYILKFYYFKKKKGKHMIGIYWRYSNINFKFFPFFFHFFYKFLNNSFFFKQNLINYSFLIYIFFDNNIYINSFIKKNILLYRIKNILIIEYINTIYLKLYKDINKEAHKIKRFSNPNVLKRWQCSYIKFFKNSSTPKVAEIYTKIYEANKKLVDHYCRHDVTSILELNLNYIFEYLWDLISKWSIIVFTNIINLIKNKKTLILMFSNYKYSLEYISWLILNSNNNYYDWHISNNKLELNLINIQLDNIIIFFLNKYLKNLILFLITPSINSLINSSFSYIFLRDFFFRITSKSNKRLFLQKFLNKQNKVIYFYKFNYFSFFKWQINAFVGVRRFLMYFVKYKMYYSGIYID